MHVVVVIAYILAVAANVSALRRVRLVRLQFIDGIVIGMTYYITIPMFFVLIAGRISPDFIPISEFLPYEDLMTTAVILGGIIGISLLKIILHYLYLEGQKAELARWIQTDSRYQVSLFFALLVMQTIETLAIFVLSGAGSGGNWLQAGQDLQTRGTFFVLLPVLHNFVRTAVFAALAAILLWQERSPLQRWWWLFGLYSVVLDMAFVFNRITVLYFLFLTLIAFRKHAYKAASSILILLLAIAQFSTAWTYFRAYIGVNGYSPPALTEGLLRSLEATSDTLPFVDRINGAFESINITVLNWVVRYHWRLDIPFGAYIVRPATVLIPRSIWPGRPSVFPVMIGQAIKGDVPLNSTLFAEPYANSPMLWPLMLGGAIVLYDFLFRRLARHSPSWSVIGAFIGLAWWRFDSSFPATCVIFAGALAMAMWLYISASTKPRTVRRLNSR